MTRLTVLLSALLIIGSLLLGYLTYNLISSPPQVDTPNLISSPPQVDTPLQLPSDIDAAARQSISVGQEQGYHTLTIYPIYQGNNYQINQTISGIPVVLTVIKTELTYSDQQTQTVNILAGIADDDGREWKTTGFREGRNGDRTLLSGSEVVAKLKPGDRLELGSSDSLIPQKPSVQEQFGVPEEGMRLVLNDIIKSFWDEAKSPLETTGKIPDGLIFRAGKFIKL